MPNVKISDAADAGTLVASDMLPLARSGNTNAYHATMAEVAAFASTSLASGAYGNVGRNLCHNPLMNIAQRGAGPWSSGYTVDRWASILNSDTMSIARLAQNDSARAEIGDEASEFCLYNTFTGTAGASAFNAIYQHIEDVRRLAGKAATISFWAAASAALKLGVGPVQHMGTGGSPSADVTMNGQSVTLSGTWTRYSLTFAFPSLAGKTLGSNPDNSTIIYFIFSAGSSNAAWSGNVGVQSGTVYLWGVQLEIGSVATPLEKPDPRYDLSNCQRFYQAGGTAYVAGSAGAASVTVGVNYPFPVPMRATPTIVNTSVTGSVNIGSQAFTPGSTQLIATALSGAAGGFILQLGFTASADL